MAHIRDMVGKFLVRTGMAPTVLGEAAVGDGGAIASILGGRRSPTIDTVEKLVRFKDGYGKRGSRRPAPVSLLEAPAAPLVPPREDGQPRVIAFTLARVTPVLNQTMRSHMFVLKQQRAAIAQEIKSGTEGQRPTEPFARALVRVERRSIGRPDWEGVVGGLKGFFDVLQPASMRHPNGLGIIENDSPDCMKADIVPIRVPKRALQGMRVVITEVLGTEAPL